jgi:hypothetical protein
VSEREPPSNNKSVKLNAKDDKLPLRDAMGPLIIDQTIRTAVSHCWRLLPPEERTADRVESEIMRIVKRVVEDMREDIDAFDFSSGASTTSLIID